jgi:hypothetical protein
MAVHGKARDGRAVGVTAKEVEAAVRTCIICASKQHSRIITPGNADNRIAGACEISFDGVELFPTAHVSSDFFSDTCSTLSR